MAAFQEETRMEMGDGDGPDDEGGAESSYGIEFTAEDAAVRGSAPRDVVVASNVLSVIAGASPSAAPGYGLLSSSNPALAVDHARDAVIPGEDSVDVTQEGLVVEDLMEDADVDETEPEDATIASLQMVGVIPFILPLFTPRCTLHIAYTTRLMVEVDAAQYLNWALVNHSEKNEGAELVRYEVVAHGRRPHLFVCYSQSRPFHLVGGAGRQGFDLRSFAAVHGLDNPVAAVYVIAE